MKRRTLLQAGAAGLTPATSISLAAAASTSGREVLALTQGWRFHDGDIPFPKILGHDWTYGSAKAGSAQGAAAPDYDDSDWPLVNLPHDFAASQPIEQGTNVSQGYRRRGMAWYRQSLKFDEADRGRHLELQIDGAATHATVWFNGTLVHHNYSGYNEMAIDLTPYATYGEAVNTIVVRVDAVAMEGWWYEGAGLYREVRIVKRAPTHIVTDGVFAHPVKRAEGWVIPIEVTLATLADKTQPVTIECELQDARGTHAKASTRATVASLRQAVAKLQIKHDKPEEPFLWSPARPHLYRVVTRVLQGGQVLDELTTPCGFRTQHFDADRGFFLNGQPLKIQGVCIHQDHAGVGVAVPPALIDFRLRRLKELGCNAIRCSHNAQDRAFMDACDRLGFLVMAENRLFNPSPQYVEQQLKWLVRRDRNHPSVFMWSVFNEEPMQGTAGGYEMVRRMREVVRDLDTSRPVTAAMNDGLFTPLNVSHALDVLGFNYQQDQYDAVHAARPQLPLMSSEDTSAFMLRGYYGPRDDKRHLIPSYDDDAAPWGATHRKAWKAIAERPFIAGGFVWTGFDYHGEPTPYEWPSNSSVFGIMDLCGFEKTAFHIHQAQWVHDRPVLALVPHWNWQGREGQPVKVMVCSNLDEVGLELNGRLLGRQPVDRWTMNHWQVPYEAGTLRALGWKAGRLVAKAQVETVGAPTALRLVPDRSNLRGDGVDVVPVRVEAIDAQGRAHPLANHMVQFRIEGGEIIGLGNGDSNSIEPEKGDRRSLFHGLAQVIVRSNAGGTGELKLSATSEGLQGTSISLALTTAAAPRQQATGTSVQLLQWWQRAPLQATAPDPQLQPPPQDMNSWQGFQAGGLLPAATAPGYVLCAINHTPYSRIRREGGWVEATSVSGRCEVYSNGILLGRKTDPAAAPLKLRLPPGEGQRRLAFVFQVEAGEKVGLGGVVRVRV